VRAFLAIVRVTLRQVLGGKRWILLGLLSFVPAVVMWFSSANATADEAFVLYHEAPLGLLLLIVLPVVALVIGAGAIGDERRDATLSFLLLRPIRRATIVGAKFVAAWLATTLIVAAAGGLASAVVSLRTDSWQTLGPTVVALALSSAAYTAVFLVLGHLTSRAVLVGLVYVFIWESGFTYAAPGLANVSLSRIGLTAYAALVPDSTRLLADPLGSLTPGVGGALTKALVIAAACVLFGGFLLKRGDAAAE